MFLSFRRLFANISILRGHAAAADAGRGAGAESLRKRATIELVVQAAVTLALLGSGLHILMTDGYSEAVQKLAAGWVGAVAGYWLR